MSENKKWIFMTIAMVVAFLAWGFNQAGAQKKIPPGQAKKVTQAEREAAADRAAALGFELPEIGTVEMAPPGSVPRYFSHPNYANSPLPLTTDGSYATPGDVVVEYTGIRKFMDGLPGLGVGAANNLGQYIPVAVPDTTTYPGSDYYEIAVVQYREKMHTDLPPTLLRGYVQVSTDVVPGEQVQLTNALLQGGTQFTGKFGVTPPHYLGPTIIAQKNRPVRIKFYNLLPTGVDGDLFIPVDTSVMGSGKGQELEMGVEIDPQNLQCGDSPKPYGCYTDNRAVLHLHGGISPWISDGTPHQWITPANENTPYPQGVSVYPVPDMGDNGNPKDGMMTYYYTNQQSARLMFYHDHAWGITRLNVYAGEAAPYIITDDTEKALINSGLIPGADATIPLVIQDKTFVPKEAQLAVQDETWDLERWGGEGDLWLPHVYSPAQNPGDASGINEFGRWAYGPWFWPPTLGIAHGPIDNPYFDPDCDPDVEWCEPPLMPGTPFNSMGMEAFVDTPVVNGTAYPTLEVDPKSYRLRILNAANDRFFNLSLYVAMDANGDLCDETNTTPASESTGVTCTEVFLNPLEVEAAREDSTIFPTPVVGTEGPNWIQIGTEGGFLPAPVTIPAQPTTWVNDPTVFNAGNVDKHSLLLGPAERGDVIVDFSAFAGQTLILYNDAPAAFPARDPRYDYYTGNGDYIDTGGTPSTLPGYGPNTRTIMQIKVANVPAAPSFNLGALQNAFAHKADGTGVFESGQHPIIVGQQAYNSVYGTNFKSNDGLVQIYETSKTFPILAGGTLTIPFQPKMIQDEMGEAFEREYGRMSGNLGVESPNPQAGQQNMILYDFVHPPTEIIDPIELKPGESLERITSADDGTQIWKITHNGVDTHPIHFHLYDVQLINRVGWDGIIRKPDANELGWKDTVRISPLEDTIVALRPLLPTIPWDLPNSIRLLNPAMPEGAYLANSTQADQTGVGTMAFDPTGEPIDIFNHYVNFGWEYVWHCHILSHEEMDMMRAQVVGAAPRAPDNLTVSVQGGRATLSWNDNSLNETGFILQRATDPSFTTGFTEIPLGMNTISYVDSSIQNNRSYYYRIVANNLVGDTWDYTDPAINEGASFPTKLVSSDFSNTAIIGGAAPPNAPTNLVATVQAGPQVSLTWIDNATNETGFAVERCTGASCTNFVVIAAPGGRNSTGSVTYVDTTVSAGNTYNYRVNTLNAGGPSEYTNIATASVPLPPAAPTGVSVSTRIRNNNNAYVTMNWTHSGPEVIGFTIQRATNPTFTANLANYAVTADVRTWEQNNAARRTTYYFRIRANGIGGSSAWTNAAPFPITTP